MSTPIGDPRPAGQDGPAGDQRPPGDDGPAGDPRPAGNTDSKDDGSSFDPSAHTVEEVNAYIAGVGDDEKQRVLDAEKAGKNRTSVG
jgi:hypothetical protein